MLPDGDRAAVQAAWESGCLQFWTRWRWERITRLLLVRAGETYYFLGVTQGSITCLEKLTAEEAEAWMGGADGAAAPKMGFQEALHSALEQRKQQRRP